MYNNNSKLQKTKQAYYKSVKEAEAAKSVFDESSESKMFSSKVILRLLECRCINTQLGGKKGT
jgi:hypothetical protein